MCEDLDEELNPPDALPAKNGWRYAETRIRWQGALAGTVWRDEETCFNHKMPVDFWIDYL